MSVENLNVYEKINNLVFLIYKSTKNFPRDELYGIVSQMKRAAISIGSNLLEGSYRGSTKEIIHFIDIAKGSAAELKYQVFISRKLNFVDNESFINLDSEIEAIIKMLTALQRSLRKK